MGKGGLFGSNSPPPAPTPTPPPPVPDVNAPENLAAKRKAMAQAGAMGRGATQLTTPMASTIAGGNYAGTKAGG